MGVNIDEILIRALQSSYASSSCTPGRDSPALVLGAALGEMVLERKDKVTLLVEKPLQGLELWLEQLMAESTGKEGTGLIPISGEPCGDVGVYGDDRLFVYLTLKNRDLSDEIWQFDDALLKSAVARLREAGQPVVTIEISDKFDLGQEFFQWEFATAVAGSILGINAFDQPNVQESKDNTDQILSRSTGQVVVENPSLEEGCLAFYSTIKANLGTELLSQFLHDAKSGDYISLMAFLPETPLTQEILQSLRVKLRDRLSIATTFGYGPRFLHSTGQLHKGGPASGLYIQLTADDTCDLCIPGKPYTFGAFKRAQAQGDLDALRKHGRRAIRIHLGRDVEEGLKELSSMVSYALRPPQ